MSEIKSKLQSASDWLQIRLETLRLDVSGQYNKF